MILAKFLKGCPLLAVFADVLPFIFADGAVFRWIFGCGILSPTGSTYKIFQ
jgi:hypothetical protein